MGWLGSGFFSEVNHEKGVHVGVSGFAASLPGIHLNFLHRARLRGSLHDDRRHDHRPADAAPARRLHRDRDARVRRDHRPHRGQRRRDQALRRADCSAAPLENAFGKDQTFTAGRQGITPVDKIDLPFVDPFTSLNLRPWYWVALGLVAVVLFVNFRLRDSRLGRAWIALREDEVAAVSMGVPSVKTKLLAYGTGAAFGGIAGALPRVVPEHGQRRPVPVLLLDPGPRHGHPRRPRLDLGRRPWCDCRCRSSTTTSSRTSSTTCRRRWASTST